LENKLLESLDSHDFDTLFLDINNIIDSNSVEITQNKNFRLPYMNREILDLIVIRNNFYKLKRKFPNFSYAAIQFKFYRNKVVHMLRKAKKDFVDNYFQVNANDAKKVWNQINTLI
jgi:hypothetical protein